MEILTDGDFVILSNIFVKESSDIFNIERVNSMRNMLREVHRNTLFLHCLFALVFFSGLFNFPWGDDTTFDYFCPLGKEKSTFIDDLDLCSIIMISPCKDA